MEAKNIGTHLIQFTAGNYRSIREPVTLSLVASAKNKSENTFDLAASKEHLLNVAVIFGVNAGGKSNLLRALFLMGIVTRGDAQLFAEHETVVPFRLDAFSEKEDSLFEVSLEHNGRLFVHGFSVSSEKKAISKEWLKFADRTHPRLTSVFERDKDSIKFNSNIPIKVHGISRSYTKQIASSTPFVASVSKLAAHSFASEVVNAWKDVTVLNTISHDLNQSVGHALANNPKLKQELIPFLQLADFNIFDVDVETKDQRHKVSIGHRVLSNGQGKQKYELVYFDLNGEESTGTRKFLEMAYVIQDILENGGVLAIDELGSSLHPKLLRYVVRLFKEKNYNKRNAQLILTAHEVSMIEFLSRDEVYFANKNAGLATELYSLSDFKGIRQKTAKLTERYLRGDYGAVPEIPDEA